MVVSEFMIKIHIHYKTKDQAWGGGNQFLKALKAYLRNMGAYEDRPECAQVVLFNRHNLGNKWNLILSLYKLWRLKSRPAIIYRVDGPISVVRQSDASLDRLIFFFSKVFAAGIVFQSEWSRRQNQLMGMPNKKLVTVITNAPDPTIFYPGTRNTHAKTRIIATAWSANFRKGFDIYRYLDEHLDWDRYEMTFVGNSPIEFTNIKHVPPVKSDELAALLRGHDMFISASALEACSNSLGEALHCGLPVVVINSSSNPEIVGSAGELFNGKEDLLNAIDKVATSIDTYRNNINLPTISGVGDAYYRFATEAWAAQSRMSDSNYSLFDLAKLFCLLVWTRYGPPIRRRTIDRLSRGKSVQREKFINESN